MATALDSTQLSTPNKAILDAHYQDISHKEEGQRRIMEMIVICRTKKTFKQLGMEDKMLVFSNGHDSGKEVAQAMLSFLRDDLGAEQPLGQAPPSDLERQAQSRLREYAR